MRSSSGPGSGDAVLPIRVALALCGLALLGLVDRELGPGYALGPAYLLLIIPSAYWGGVREGLLLAIAASGVWLYVGVSTDLHSIGAVPFIVNLVGRTAMNVFVAVIVGRFRMQQVEMRRALSLDWLTSFANSEAFRRELRLIVQQAALTGAPVAVLAVDCDGYETLADRYGAKTCDAFTIAVGEKLRTAARSRDVVARVGDGRFAIVAPDTDEVTARRVAERIRATALRLLWTPDGSRLPVTVSVGVACSSGRSAGGSAIDGEALLNRATDAAHATARSGGDGVMVR